MRRFGYAAIWVGLCAAALPATALFPTASAIAQVTADDAEITVIGFSKSYRLKYKHLKKAMRKFDEGKAELAPESTLYFEVWPTNPDDDVADMQLELVPKKGDAVPIIIDADGRFVMPVVAGNDWRLTANRGQKSIAIKPIVLSPGTSETDRRLGDIRLQCPVMVAVMASTMSIFEKGAFGLMGGCNMTAGAIYFTARHPLQSAVIREGDRTEDLPLAKLNGDTAGRSFRPPLTDETWSNDARVTLTYQPKTP